MALEALVKELLAQVRAHYPLLYLVTSEEERLERVMGVVAEKAGVSLVRWSVASGFSLVRAGEGKPPALPADATEPCRALSEVARGPDRVLYLFEDLHLHWSDGAAVRALRETVRQLPKKSVTIALVGPQLKLPAELEKETAVRELPYPDPHELGVILERVIESFPEGKRPQAADAVKHRMRNAAAGLTENEARRLFAKALLLRPQFSDDDLQLLLSEKKQIISQSEMLEFFESAEDLGSIGGLEELKDWLASRERAFSDEARAFGLPQPKGLLLLGVQGCGKSLTAKAVANLWRMPLLRLDFGAVFSSPSAGPDENLRRALRTAESVAPAVLWVDEIEKGLAGMEQGSAVAGITARVLGSFLTWMQEKKEPVFVVATANSIEFLPPELLRKGRFDEIFFVDLPNIHERRKIFEIHLKKRGRDAGAFDCETLARECEKFSGAEIEESLIAAMYDAFSENRDVNEGDIRRALRSTVPLAVTQEERIAALKDWARDRARRASLDTRMLDVFGKGGG